MEIDCAEDGIEAVNIINEAPEDKYDLVLMDIQMPNMNGFVAARAIRKVAKPDAQIIPIIALSADDTLEDVRKCKEAGMNAHIAKPIDVNILMGTLDKVFKQNS